jgi:hypothetical protein
MTKTCPYCSFHRLRTSYALPSINCPMLPNIKELPGGPLMNLSGERNGCVRKRSVLKRIQAPITAVRRIKGLIERSFPDMNADIVVKPVEGKLAHERWESSLDQCGSMRINADQCGTYMLAFQPVTAGLGLGHLRYTSARRPQIYVDSTGSLPGRRIRDRPVM